MTITLLYGGVLAILYLLLSGRVARLRGKYHVGIGDGGEDELAKAIRVHGNFAEFVPILVVLIALIEGSGAPDWAIHAMGAALVVCRLAHIVGLSQSIGVSAGRFIGAAGTFLLLGICGIWGILIGLGVA